MIEKTIETIPDTKRLKMFSKMQHTRNIPVTRNGKRDIREKSASVR